MEEILQTIGILALIALVVFLAIFLPVRSVSVNECAAGGYAGYVRFKGASLCLGVSADGEWEAELLTDVRAKLGER